MSKNNESFLSSIFKFSISTWVNFIIGFFSSFISTRIVSPDIYGLFNIFNTTVTTVMYITMLGLDSSLFRFYNETPNNENKKIFSFKLIIVSVISTICIAFIVITLFYEDFSTKIYGYVSQYLVYMTFITVISNLILRYLNVIYRMTFNAKQYTIQNILIQTITRCCIIAAVLLKDSFEFVVLVETLGITVLAIIYLLVQKKDIFPSKKEISKEMFTFKGYGEIFKFALFSAPTYVIVNLNLFISQQIIRIKLGSYSLGIYSSASYFITLLNVVNGGFSTFWAAYVYGNYKEQQEKISDMHNYIVMIITSVFIGMMMFKDIIYILIGDEYRASKVFVGLILIPSILDIIAQTTMYGISIKKKNYIQLINYFIMIITNFVLSLLLIPYLGMTGVALSGAISSVILYCLNTYFGQKYYKTIRDNNKSRLMILNILLIGMINTFVSNQILIVFFMLVDLLLVFYVFRKETKYLIRIVIKTLQKK